jgi:hypothetical protein
MYHESFKCLVSPWQEAEISVLQRCLGPYRNSDECLLTPLFVYFVAHACMPYRHETPSSSSSSSPATPHPDPTSLIILIDSDTMDRWKSRGGKSGKRKAEERRSDKRKEERRSRCAKR